MRCGPLACGPLVSQWLMFRLNSTAAHSSGRTSCVQPGISWPRMNPLDPAGHRAASAEASIRRFMRQHGLDPATLERGLAILIEELEGGGYSRSRAEMGRALADRGLASQGIGLAYIVMNAELAGVICSGPIRGAQQTYALLDERSASARRTRCERRQIARRTEEGQAEAFFRLRATRTAADSKRDARAAQEKATSPNLRPGFSSVTVRPALKT